MPILPACNRRFYKGLCNLHKIIFPLIMLATTVASGAPTGTATTTPPISETPPLYSCVTVTPQASGARPVAPPPIAITLTSTPK